MITRQDRNRIQRLFKLNPIISFLTTQYLNREFQLIRVKFWVGSNYQATGTKMIKATISFEVEDHTSIMSFSVVFFLWHCQHNNCIFPKSNTGPPLDIGMIWSTVSNAIGKYLPQPNVEDLFSIPSLVASLYPGLHLDPYFFARIDL
jgi:hypothetical protein